MPDSLRWALALWGGPIEGGPVSSAGTLSVNPQDVVAALGEAWSRHDLDALMTLVTENRLFDNTDPVPDGTPTSVGPPSVRCGDR